MALGGLASPVLNSVQQAHTMNHFELSVDFNGIVLFDPARLKAFFGGPIADGENLYARFTSSDAGDEVVEQGIVVPILGINDGFYKVYVRLDSEPSPIPTELLVVENREFPLEVSAAGGLVLADLYVLREWEGETGWNRIDVEPGTYAVTIRGFRRICHSEVEECGYDVVLRPCDALPALTAAINKDVQVLCLPE